MDQYIECPICEEQFGTAEFGDDKVVDCPACQRKFVLASATIVKKKVAPRQSRLSAPATFERKADAGDREERPKSSPEIRTASNATASSDSRHFQESKVIGGVLKSPAILSRNKRRQKKRLTIAIVSSIGFAILAGVLGGVLFMQLSKTPTQVADNNSDPGNIVESVESAPGVSSAQPTRESVKATQSDTGKAPNISSVNRDAKQVDKPKTASNISSEDLPEEKLRFFSKNQLDACWESVRPHLVQLKVHNARGEHDAVGTIIDSRGWIVTSYRAIKGASRIEVIASAKSIDEYGSDELLQDEVRGLIESASDPERDIAVLSINRRFVVSFADIKHASSVKIVNGAFVCQSAPPSNVNPYGRRETKILNRDRLEVLATKNEVTQKGFDNPDVNWAVADFKNKPAPGTPLTTIEGDLAAINVFTDDTTAHYVLVDKLAELVANSDGEVKPMLELGGATVEEKEMVQVNQFHPILKDIQGLNQAGDACRKFDWIATTPENYKLLQEFGEKIAVAAKFVRDNPDEAAEVLDPVKDQIETWENTVAHRYFGLAAADLDQIKEMNLIADRELRKGGQIIPFFGEVYLTGVDLVDREMYRFKDVDSNVTVPFDPNVDPRLPGKYFLFFISTPANPESQVYRPRNMKPLSFYAAELKYDVGPLNE